MITILIDVEGRAAKFALNKEIEHHFLTGGDVDIRIGRCDINEKEHLSVSYCQTKCLTNELDDVLSFPDNAAGS